jgi:hypothetical protein
MDMTENSKFELTAHFLGNRRSVAATPDGYGWQVTTDAGVVEVRSLEQAIRVARQHIGELLRKIDRKPGWGLRVQVGPVAASYGDPDPQEAVFPGGRVDPNELVARIRDRWDPGGSPVAALENALEIVKAYAGRARRQAA